MNKVSRYYLNSGGLRILSHRLSQGNLSPQVYKAVLRRQMIKQYFENSPSFFELTKEKISNSFSRIFNRSSLDDVDYAPRLKEVSDWTKFLK